MNIFVYSDESGVLDKVHNDFFVFGGLIYLSKDEKDSAVRRYLHAERTARSREQIPTGNEVKASVVSNKTKGKLYRSLNQDEKFGVIVRQQQLQPAVFASKKQKQRYLDWAYKVAVKRKLEDMITRGLIDPDKVEHMHFFVDEHTTATNGVYELRESIEQEFRFGVLDYERNIGHKPIFRNLRSVDLKYCNSPNYPLVRAADIVANHLFHEAIKNGGRAGSNEKLYIYHHP